MKSVFILCIIFFCTLFIYIKHKGLFNIAGVFVLFWGSCLFLSSLSLFDLNELSFAVCLIGAGAMVIFTVIDYFFLPFNKNSVVFEETKKVLSSNHLLIIANVFCYFFSFPYLRKSLQIISDVGMSALRDVAFTGSAEYASTAVLTIFQVFIRPLFITVIILTVIDLSRKKKAFIGAIMSVLNIILYTLLFGGRYMIFEALVLLVFAFYFSSKYSILSFIIKNKKIVILVLIGLFFMAYVTVSRSNGTLLKNLYVYFCGSFAYLDTLLQNSAFMELQLYGTGLIGFVFNFISYAAIFLLNGSYAGSSHAITQITQYTVSIGNGISYNSLGTFLHVFIADFGVYGSLFGVAIMANIFLWVQSKLLRKKTDFLLGVYLVILYSLINSVFTYSFLGPANFVLLVFIYIFTRKNKKYKK